MFDIPLLGEGSGSIESFTSYIHRCSYYHGINSNHFLKYLDREIAKVSCMMIQRNPRDLFALESLVTIGCHSDHYAGIIHKLTGRNVFDSTFYKLQSVISQPRYEVATNPRWCPECFLEARQTGLDPYLKLIWSLLEVTHCNIHRTPLSDLCPHCSKAQASMARTQPLDVCHACGGDLKTRVDFSHRSILPSWFSPGDDLIKLIVSLISYKKHFFTSEMNHMFSEVNSDIKFRKLYVYQHSECLRNGLAKSIAEFSIRFSEPEYAPAFQYCWKNRQIRDQLWVSGTPSLKTLRILAFLLNVEIFDLLTGNILNNTRSMHFTLRQKLPKSLMRIHKKSNHDHEKNHVTLTKLSLLEEPISLKEVSRRSGIDIGYIRYRFPHLLQRIVDRYRQHITDIATEKHQSARKFAFDYFNGKEGTHKKSRKHALKSIMEQSCLSKAYLKPAIQSEYLNYVNSVIVAE